jgi:dTDP-4-dehydrorhamnose 3,5-epimerase
MIENLKPVLIHEFKPFVDARGTFQKIFRSDSLAKKGFTGTFRESFISFSKPNVLRGMHFQLPPHDHWKLVNCVKGKVLDVCVNLRQGESYGAVHAFELSEQAGHSLLIPPGYAHGFLTQGSEEAGILYLTSTEHHPEYDAGIRWDSFGYQWPNSSDIVLSDRDRAFPAMDDFASPWQETESSQ